MRNLRFLGRNLYNLISKRVIPINNKWVYNYCSYAKSSNTRNIKIESENKYIYENILPNVIIEKNILKIDDWKIVRKQLLNSDRQITPINIDSMIFNFCISKNLYELAYSYIEFMKEQHIKPNISILSKYFRLFYLSNRTKFVDANAEENIVGLYKQLRSKYEVFDAMVGENIILGLSITTHWTECLKLLDEIKALTPPTTKSYVAVAATAFKYRDNKLAWSLLESVIDRKNFNGSLAYLAYLEQVKDMVGAETAFSGLVDLFNFLRLYNLKCDQITKDDLIKTCQITKVNIKTTTINRKGCCNRCDDKMVTFNLTPKQFCELKDEVLDNVIIGKDVFRKSDPEELARFESFISQMKPYDVVIDGLNVAYSSGSKKSLHLYSLLVAIMVKHFVAQDKTVLLLGRTHMEAWPERNWTYITRNADMFLTKTLSHDDPFLLYCALHSGLKTKIVSNDLMRAHLFKLEKPQMKLMFGYWLMQNQLQFKYINAQTGSVQFKPSLSYMKTPQKHERHWHIPCENNLERVDEWLCVDIPLFSLL